VRSEPLHIGDMAPVVFSWHARARNPVCYLRGAPGDAGAAAASLRVATYRPHAGCQRSLTPWSVVAIRAGRVTAAQCPQFRRSGFAVASVSIASSRLLAHPVANDPIQSLVVMASRSSVKPFTLQPARPIYGLSWACRCVKGGR
jgi:hypothetical protein